MPDAPVGLVLVSHSRALGEAVARLAAEVGRDVPIAIASGAGEDGAALGTDATAILAAFEALDAQAGAILVLMDAGSAVLAAELARDLAPLDLQPRIHLSPAPFVEGALAACVAAAGNLPIGRVLDEAASALASKRAALGEAASDADSGPTSEAMEVRVADPAGLHLRPAARIAALAAGHPVRLRCGARSARADSLTALLALGARAGDLVAIEAAGAGLQPLVDAIAAILREAGPAELPPPPAAQGGAVPVSPGRVAGPLVAAERAARILPDHPDSPPAAQRARLDAAIAGARVRLAALGPIGEAQAALLADPALLEPTHAAIDAGGVHEARAWDAVVRDAEARAAALEDPVLRARASDIREAGDAVLDALLGGSGLAAPAHPSILLIDELTASEAAALPPTVTGVLQRAGGAASHAAILLRGAGIPGLAQVTLDTVPAEIAFDGATGEIVASPDEAAIARFAVAPRPDAMCAADIVLPDGTALELWANVAGPADAREGAAAGAVGIGLARTEMLFLDRPHPPGEEEQAARLAAMIAPFRGRPVTLRLLDAGADKPVPFLTSQREANPALGLRGVRALLRQPAFLASHLRAILAAGEGHDLRVMVPMVTNAAEMQAVRAALAAEAASRGVACPPLGAMVEVPAAALTVPDLLETCDFFSIGTNDLTQYTLAADRAEPALAGLGDARHPAVLALVAGIVRAAAGRPVSVCGEAAGEVEPARRLVACGVRRLSMGASRIALLREAFAG